MIVSILQFFLFDKLVNATHSWFKMHDLQRTKCMALEIFLCFFLPPNSKSGRLYFFMNSTHFACPLRVRLKQPNLSPLSESAPHCRTMAEGWYVSITATTTNFQSQLASSGGMGICFTYLLIWSVQRCFGRTRHRFRHAWGSWQHSTCPFPHQCPAQKRKYIDNV